MLDYQLRELKLIKMLFHIFLMTLRIKDSLINYLAKSSKLQVDRDPKLAEGVVALQGIPVLVAEVAAATELAEKLLEAFLDGQVVGGIGRVHRVPGVAKIVGIIDLWSVKSCKIHKIN